MCQKMKVELGCLKRKTQIDLNLDLSTGTLSLCLHIHERNKAAVGQATYDLVLETFIDDTSQQESCVSNSAKYHEAPHRILN